MYTELRGPKCLTDKGGPAYRAVIRSLDRYDEIFGGKYIRLNVGVQCLFRAKETVYNT